MFDLNVIERGVRGLFAKEFMGRTRKVKYTKYASVVDSNKQEEKYNAISTLPQLTEMTDERVLAGFSEYSYTLKNKVYATGIKIPRQLFEFDQTGQIRTLVSSLGSRVANFPDKLIFEVVGAGDATACYDSQYFFDSDHDLGDGTSQANYITGAVDNTIATLSTVATRDAAIAAIQMNLNYAKAKLNTFTDDRGEPWHENLEPENLMILCHPYMEFYMRTAVEGAMINETSNAMIKQVGSVMTTPYTAPFIDAAGTVRYGTWYIFVLNTPIQPFIFQRFGPKTNFPDTIPEADQPILQALNSVEIQTIMQGGTSISAHTFFNDEYLFGARTIYSAGYGMWQNAIQIRDANYA